MFDVNERQGGSIFSWIKDKALPWIKSNWGLLKPVASALADVAVPAAATFFGAPQAGPAANMGLKTLTGVGVSSKSGKLVKESAEAKAHMAAIVPAVKVVPLG
ncbi:uncharacterized protein PHALS_00511 [Plasmopara halstedii]|uniref:Uncharacterized protein n=1 Tax=Plasmopara halstedii TaxID=4781 RepID=A0A0P1A7F3_PLAHL|nr:uncharacterized protein PHALS_00511 [Plasmopara halstedii]CEG36189.1 hypothetical protein PHALS_00511 [Plasmopara halstedii]|eukprot:XP_024572558.1 hypothetical protein PHALS_00511 [Plasmopara halstedii]